MARALVPVLLLALSLGSAHARWEDLGPPGGMTYTIAPDPTAASRMYALTRAGERLYRSEDGGATWAPVASPPACGDWLQVRADGHVFVNCRSASLRSRDGGRSWETFYQPAFPTDISPFRFVFDPAVPQRATASGTALFTPDDGRTWIRQFVGEFIPISFGYDETTSARLVAVGTVPRQTASGYLYPLEAYESFDSGLHWTPYARLRPASEDATPCFERSFGIDSRGGALVIADCGVFRSPDGGRTWRPVASIPLDAGPLLAGDRSRPGRWIATSGGNPALSVDGGARWSLLPALPAAANAFAFDRDGTPWAATSRGLFRHAASNGVWEPRNAGLHARPLHRIETLLASSGPVLLALPVAPSVHDMPVQTRDGGATWSEFAIRGQPVAYVAPHATHPAAAWAFAGPSLHVSTDGGGTWSEVAARPTVATGDTIGTPLAPVGVAHVYATWQRCISSGFTGCWMMGVGVARSTDGGRSWAKTGEGITGIIAALAASPVDGTTLFASTDVGLHASPDGGATWSLRLPGRNLWPVASPHEARRWYAHGSGSLRVTRDGGATWTQAALPFAGTAAWDLVADPRVPGRLYAVAANGTVRASDDHAATWRDSVAGRAGIAITAGSARLAPGPGTLLHAASTMGVLRVALDANARPLLADAVEFHHAALDHYFVTAEPHEVAALDDGTIRGWVRTGESFGVLQPGSTAWGASNVCRFHGAPARGFGGHFYSASPAECAEVRERFADAWLFESEAVFAVPVPDRTNGACPAGTRPVYRVYNARADANHRYTTSLQTRDRMLALGWVAEGYGPQAVVMCSPLRTPAP